MYNVIKAKFYRNCLLGGNEIMRGGGNMQQMMKQMQKMQRNGSRTREIKRKNALLEQQAEVNCYITGHKRRSCGCRN